MIGSTNSVSVPLIAPSVNVQTEQVARDNRVKQPVPATAELAKSAAEAKIKSDEKRRRSQWDPAEHPDYDVDEQEQHELNSSSAPESEIDRLFRLLALSSYSDTQGKGYAMRFRLPKRVLEDAVTQGKMIQRRTVIKYHYGKAIAPNTPSEVIAVL
jgi:hypothetical protein